MKRLFGLFVLFSIHSIALIGCTTAPDTSSKRNMHPAADLANTPPTVYGQIQYSIDVKDKK